MEVTIEANWKQGYMSHLMIIHLWKPLVKLLLTTKKLEKENWCQVNEYNFVDYLLMHKNELNTYWILLSFLYIFFVPVCTMQK